MPSSKFYLSKSQVRDVIRDAFLSGIVSADELAQCFEAMRDKAPDYLFPMETIGDLMQSLGVVSTNNP